MSTKGLKEIRKFVQQAKKVEKRFPSISYYCRMAAVLKAMQIKEKTDEEKAALNELLGWLESNKSHKLPDKEQAKETCEAWAMQVFTVADNEDRSGNATNQTALSFNAAHVFFEVCRQFGELSLDTEEKRKYSLFKVVDIRKALKEGRKPLPGSRKEQEEAKLQEELGGSDGLPMPGGSDEYPMPAGSNDLPLPGGGNDLPMPSGSDSYPMPGGNDELPMPSGSDSYPMPGGNDELPMPSGSDEYPMPAGSDELPMPSGSAGPSMPAGLGSAPQAGYPIGTPSAPSEAYPDPSGSHSSHSSIPNQPPATGCLQMTINAAPANLRDPLARTKAVAEAERVMKHAVSALRFDDVPTTLAKLQQAVALLLHFNSPAEDV